MPDDGPSPTTSTSTSNAEEQKANSAQLQSKSRPLPQPQSHLNPLQEHGEHQQQPSSRQSTVQCNAQSTTSSSSPSLKKTLAVPNPSTSPKRTSSSTISSLSRPSSSSSILPIPIPGPLKKLFDRFPLITYPPNELPLRAPVDRQRHYRRRRRQRQQQQYSPNSQKGRDSQREDGQELREHALYVFTSEDGAKLGLPSFNPGCLKWQVYLKFQGIRFRTVKSNNHASPNGILPFVIPATANISTTTSTTVDVPISSGGLKRWADGQGASSIPSVRDGETGSSEETSGLVDARHDAYMSLINSCIRRAWLHNLYLNPSNFSSVAYPRYIQPASSNTLLQASISSTLRAAAISELLKHDTYISISVNNSSDNSYFFSNVIDSEHLYEQANEAFEALEIRLGSCDGDGNRIKWLSGRETPGLADAALFAYTHLLLDERMGWADGRMMEMLKGKESVVRHRDRILEMFF